jgi:ABC-type glycerol-3-phosphate transport system substrate-binding protein
MTTASDGRVFVKFYDQNGSTLKYIDAQKKDFGEAVILPSALNTGNYQTYIGPGYDLYIKNETAVYGCNSDSTEPVELLNLINSDINSNSMQSLIVIDADHFIYTGYDMVTNKQQIAFLSRIPDGEVKEKYLINLSYINADYNLISYVVKFNQANDTYRIVMNNYGKYNTQDDYNLGAATLTNEITSGKIPDILILDSYGLDIKSLTGKGLFCDLYKFLDNDPDISRSDLLSCITAPFETDGKLYRLVTSFYIQTLAGKTANIGSAASWTTDEMLAVLDRAGEDVLLFDNFTKTQMLAYLCMMGYSEFIDYTTGSCSFDSESFIKLLEYCNTLPAEYNGNQGGYDQNADRFIGYREDKVLLYNVFLSSFSDYLQTQFAFGFEPVNLIGYPTSTGNGAMIQASASYAITENSAVKEGAWQFLKYLLSDECQINENRGMPGWPATISALQALAKKEMAQYNFFSYSGGRSSSSEPFDQNMQNEPGLPGKLTQEDVDTVTAYLDTITSSSGYDRQVMEIINEETAPFFAGTKTAADAAKIIQSRISIYINETK